MPAKPEQSLAGKLLSAKTIVGSFQGIAGLPPKGAWQRVAGEAKRVVTGAWRS